MLTSGTGAVSSVWDTFKTKMAKRLGILAKKVEMSDSIFKSSSASLYEVDSIAAVFAI